MLCIHLILSKQDVFLLFLLGICEKLEIVWSLCFFFALLAEKSRCSVKSVAWSHLHWRSCQHPPETQKLYFLLGHKFCLTDPISMSATNHETQGWLRIGTNHQVKLDHWPRRTKVTSHSDLHSRLLIEPMALTDNQSLWVQSNLRYLQLLSTTAYLMNTSCGRLIGLLLGWYWCSVWGTGSEVSNVVKREMLWIMSVGVYVIWQRNLRYSNDHEDCQIEGPTFLKRNTESAFE